MFLNFFFLNKILKYEFFWSFFKNSKFNLKKYFSINFLLPIFISTYQSPYQPLINILSRRWTPTIPWSTWQRIRWRQRRWWPLSTSALSATVLSPPALSPATTTSSRWWLSGTWWTTWLSETSLSGKRWWTRRRRISRKCVVALKKLIPDKKIFFCYQCIRDKWEFFKIFWN